ncbi:ribonuclease P protein component [Thalassorhabdus alkalitolerans]|uniref:Ribonuclease P protein component n=1 Tax=Thalassorhabdus alkalitolerans TaxID=2282697 RepID=A0ABW0YHN3_9BACI
MKKEYRIKKNEEFSAVFQKGTSFANRQLVIYVMDKPGQEHFRVGLTVSKKVGNAVTRNRIKRHLRELVREFKDDMLQEKDYVIIARNPVANMDYHEIKKSLIHVMKRGKILRSSRQSRQQSPKNIRKK